MGRQTLPIHEAVNTAETASQPAHPSDYADPNAAPKTRIRFVFLILHLDFHYFL